jgi:NhaA family Na+:H+ antiporter
MIGFDLLWLAVLASGVHPTVAGVLTALTIPLGPDDATSPLHRLEHRLHPWVMFGVMGLFGFASAGVAIEGAGELLQPLPLGVMLGLFVGKQLGVFGALWLAVRSGWCAPPANVRWSELYGAALLCGIGFTMSLFIGALAFPGAPHAVEAAKIGTLAGSLLSALAGWAVLRFASRPVVVPADAREAAEIFAADLPD